MKLANRLLIVGLLAVTPPCWADPLSYGIVDLGPPGVWSSAAALNSAGQVIGAYSSDQGPRAFLFSGGVTQDLGLPGGGLSQAVINVHGDVAISQSGIHLVRAGQISTLGFHGGVVGINASGTIAGTRAGPESQALAFLYSSAGLEDISLGGRSGSTAHALSDAGVVVGQAHVGDAQFGVPDAIHPFVYRNGAIEDLGTFGGRFGAALAVNNSGQVVGVASTEREIRRAFLVADGAKRDLGSLVDREDPLFGPILGTSVALFITDSGVIVGWSDAIVTVDASPFPYATVERHVFSYSNGVMRDISTSQSRALYPIDVNELGWIVGSGVDNEGAAFPFLYRDGVLHDLRDLIPAESGWSFIVESLRINDAGQIAGTGVIGNNDWRAFLMTPVPEPRTWLLMVAGLFLLGRRHGWRPPERRRESR